LADAGPRSIGLPKLEINPSSLEVWNTGIRLGQTFSKDTNDIENMDETKKTCKL
jgi:hypothetical protein